MSGTTTVAGGGPYFDELEPGRTFDDAPAVTLTPGLAATHQSIVGDRLRLALDARLSRAVTGGGQLAHPALVWDLAIGQSTVATHHVRANLFYRNLAFHRFPAIGDTLSTTTEVVGLRQNRPRPDRPATGLAALRITTVDQEGRTVLDFWRCAMLPLSSPEVDTGHDDDLSELGTTAAEAPDPVAGWDLGAFHRPASEPAASWSAGTSVQVSGGDVVSSAPELARLTLNVARVHHDAAAGGGRRLVYGGHTIGIACAQATRAFPSMVTVLDWKGCDHTGPVFEGDTLRSVLTVEGAAPRPDGGTRVDLRSEVTAEAIDGEPRPVLDWRFTALMA